MSVLEIKDLHVEIEGKEILKGVNLTLKTGEIAAIMGPNGTGKSTLSAAIMGNPNYEVTKGGILFDGVNILELEVDERARMGLFLAMLAKKRTKKFLFVILSQNWTRKWNSSI